MTFRSRIGPEFLGRSVCGRGDEASRLLAAERSGFPNARCAGMWRRRPSSSATCGTLIRAACRRSVWRLWRPRMNQVINAARSLGVMIVHSPSDTMKFYEGTPWRERMQRLADGCVRYAHTGSLPARARWRSATSRSTTQRAAAMTRS